MRAIKPKAPPKLTAALWLATPVAHLQMLLVLAVMLGGGGVAYGLRNLAIQLCALAIVWWHREQAWNFIRRGPKALVALVLVSMAVPLLQLVPLPPHIWQDLPGRQVVAQAYALAGLPADSWYPLSLDRGRTLVAFCGTLAPAVIIAIGSSLNEKDRAQLAWTAAAAALAALIIGVAQLTSANTSGLFYPITAKSDVLYATFANRNSTALMFVLSIIILTAVPVLRGRGWLALGTAGIALFAVATVLTQSRSGMALLAVALVFVLARIGFGLWQVKRWRYRANRTAVIIAAILGFAALGAIAVSAFSGGRAATSLDRFSEDETARPLIWEDAAYGAREYWPLGSGMATFDEVFQLHESLEYMSPRRAGRAHNDYIELAMEAGLVGYLVLLGWVLWIAQAALICPSHMRWTRMGAALGLACIAAQSVLDYPLRNQTLLCFAALLVVLLASQRKEKA